MPVGAQKTVLPFDEAEAEQERHGDHAWHRAHETSGAENDDKGEASGQTEPEVADGGGGCQSHGRVVARREFEHPFQVGGEVQRILPGEQPESEEGGYIGGRQGSGSPPAALNSAQQQHRGKTEPGGEQVRPFEQRKRSENQHGQPGDRPEFPVPAGQQHERGDQDGEIMEQVVDPWYQENDTGEPKPTHEAGLRPAEQLEQQNAEPGLQDDVSHQAQAEQFSRIGVAVEDESKRPGHRDDVGAPLERVMEKVRVGRVVGFVQALVECFPGWRDEIYGEQ